MRPLPGEVKSEELLSTHAMDIWTLNRYLFHLNYPIKDNSSGYECLGTKYDKVIHESDCQKIN